ncbi:ABC transporter ATP-binding protein [Nonomuraea aridisoli]|uniref:ABC transporter ATP-binding protein n=1 Tax=Nonomuraea aridisoli TaxID=2070368 RepID=A0A2W2ECL0_9ACTN|nr:ABC transporter ATP-binding protein [Nonomuraea aridisoli]PZG20263.1 ABC transporter ATP-binding protein [Nonomuraea aridisoli]
MIEISIRDVTMMSPVVGPDGPRAALSGLDLDVRAGELLTLVGPSGCGKSTLLDLVAGLCRPTRGEVLVDGVPVAAPHPGVVVQQYDLFPWRTAQANVEFALEGAGVPGPERARRAREHLALAGLSGQEDHYPHELSAGLRRRVALARSLAFGPRVLLMDEPFAGLDAAARASLRDDLVRVWERTGMTVLLVTHGIDEALRLGRRVAVMTRAPGRIKEIVDVRLDDRRAGPAFGAYRRHVWSLLRGEVTRAREAALHG